jgi:hypothetical protein
MNIGYLAEIMKDYTLEQIQLRVRKIWLQDFAKFCKNELS